MYFTQQLRLIELRLINNHYFINLPQKKTTDFKGHNFPMESQKLVFSVNVLEIELLI